jgi:hypothetical protein
VPDTGTFMQVCHDYETALWNFQPRAFVIGWNKENNPQGAYPDTCVLPGLNPDEFYPLSFKWQRFWLEMMNRASYGLIPQAELVKRWATITSDGRALTDRHTWNWVKTGEPKLFIDYVQWLNLESPYGPMQQKSLTMGGNIVRVLGSSGNNYVIEAFDLSVPPPLMDNVWGQWWLIHWGTQSTITPYGSRWRITDWAWLNWEGVGYGVPFMLISRDGTNLIPKDWCRPIANGAEYSPYIP